MVNLFIFTAITLKMIELNGRNAILYNNHTFSKSGRPGRNLYRCSRKSALSCKARIRFDQNMKVTQIVDEHLHSPPKLFVTGDGKYVKIR